MNCIKTKIIGGILGAFLLCSPFFSEMRAQDHPDVATSDAITYRQYLNSSWDSLVITGNRYLNNGIDYYYLRLRMGIAYSQKQNYAMAIRHFTKALAFAPSDPITMEHLYYANLYKGNDFEARIWSNRLSSGRRKELGIAPHFIEGYSGDITYNFASSKEIPGITDSDIIGTQQRTESFVNANIMLKHLPAQWLKIVHGYTYLNKTNQYYIKALDTEAGFSDKVVQSQYYVSGIVYPLKGWQLAVSYQQIWTSAPILVTDTEQAAPSSTSFSSTDYSFSASVLKSLGYFDAGYTYTASALNQYKQRQHTLQLNVYPLGNLNVYLLNKLILFSENSVPKNNAVIIGETLGFKLASYCWAEAGIMAGSIRNLSDYGSYIIYNDENSIKWKSGVNLLFPLKSGVTLSVRAHYYDIESDFSDATINNTVSYSTISLTGGLSWKF